MKQLQIILIIAFSVMTFSPATVVACDDDADPMIRAKYKGLNGLLRLLRTTPRPDQQSLGTVFVSTRAIDSLLSVFNGIKISLENTDGASITINNAVTQFENGFSGVRTDADINARGHSFTARIDGNLVLNEIDGNNLVLQLKILKLTPLNVDGMHLDTIRRVIQPIVNWLLPYVLNLRDELSPKFVLPLSRKVSINQPEKTNHIETQLGQGRMRADLVTPGYQFSKQLFVNHLLILEGGILISINNSPPDPESILPMSCEGFDSDNPQAAVTMLQQEIQQLVRPFNQTGNDSWAFISTSVFQSLFNQWNNRPPQERAFRFRNTSGVVFHEQGNGGLGCGGYVEIRSPGHLNGRLVIDRLATDFSSGNLRLNVSNLTVGIRARIHGHVNGPPGLGCDHPIGNGFGIHPSGNLRASTPVTMQLNFEVSNNDQVSYSMLIISPRNITANGNISLDQLGNHHFSERIDIPTDSIASSVLENILLSSGRFDLGEHIDSPHERYEVKFNPNSVNSSGNGIKIIGRYAISVQ